MMETLKLRNTIQRSVILEAVRSLHNHPTAEEVYATVRTSIPNISKGTVYRNLKILAMNGVIRHVSMPDSADRFDHTLGIHHHFQCKHCKRVFDVSLKKDISELVDIGDDLLIEGYNIVFTGLCPDCK